MTGYPPELLDTDLDLEADLGVDTVKQAEVFAAVRAQFGIPRDDNMKLREFPTLAHVIAFARDRGQGAAPAAAQPQAAAPAAPAPAAPVPAAPAQPAVQPAPAAAGPGGACGGRGTRGRACRPGRDHRPDRADRRGHDRLPARAAGHRPRPGGRPRRRHGQAGRSVRGCPRAVRHPPRRQHEAARIPDPRARHRVRPRPGTGGSASRRAAPGCAAPAAAAVPAAAAAPATPAPAAAPPVTAPVRPRVVPRAEPAFKGDVSAAERLPRRVPGPVLRPPSAWCKPTGVTLDGSSRVIVMADEGGVGDALVGGSARSV